MDVSTCKTSSDNRWGGCWGQQEVRNGVCGELQVLGTHDGRPGVMKGWPTVHKKAKSGFLLQSCAHLQPRTSLPFQVCVRVCAAVHVSSYTRSHTCHRALTSTGPRTPAHLTLTSVAHRLQVVEVTSPGVTRRPLAQITAVMTMRG